MKFKLTKYHKPFNFINYFVIVAIVILSPSFLFTQTLFQEKAVAVHIDLDFQYGNLLDDIAVLGSKKDIWKNLAINDGRTERIITNNTVIFYNSEKSISLKSSKHLTARQNSFGHRVLREDTKCTKS